VNHTVAIAGNISASSFQQECDKVETVVRKSVDGSIRKEILYARFPQWEPNKFDQVLTSLKNQGRLRENQVRNKGITLIELNRGEK